MLLRLYQSLPAFKDCVHTESCIFLAKKECSCCGHDMEDRPYGMVGVSVSYKPAPDADRHYYPIYHLVCKPCFELMNPDPKNQPRQPEWSVIWALTYKHRPFGVSVLTDEEMLTTLFKSMARKTSTWEEFSELTGCNTMAGFLGL